MSHLCYTWIMPAVAARELRNHTSDVIKRVQSGEDVTLTNRGEPIARIIPIDRARRDFLTPAEVLAIPKMDADFGRLLDAMGLEDVDSFDGAL